MGASRCGPWECQKRLDNWQILNAVGQASNFATRERFEWHSIKSEGQVIRERAGKSLVQKILRAIERAEARLARGER